MIKSARLARGYAQDLGNLIEILIQGNAGLRFSYGEGGYGCEGHIVTSLQTLIWTGRPLATITEYQRNTASGHRGG